MVITKLVGAIPIIGDDFVQILWGGCTIGGVTLNRFYVFHYFLALFLGWCIMAHLNVLHEYGSNNSTGFISKYDSIPFVPYYALKDYALFIFVFYMFLYYVIFSEVLTHPDNFVQANSLLTPSHIVPE